MPTLLDTKLAEEVRGKYRELVGRANALRTRLESTEAYLEELGFEAAVAEQAAALIRSYSDEQSDRLRTDIERLVTYGVQSVFDDPHLSFKVETRVLRGQTAVEFALVSTASGEPVERPIMGAHGGGVAEVVGFVLRVVVTLLSGRRRLLVLDEPFSRVSANYRPRLAQFIREVADKTGLQMLIVTHDEEIPAIADYHYVLTLRNGVTQVQRSDADL